VAMVPYVDNRPVENFYLVRERDRRRVRELVWVLFGLLPVAMCLLGYTWIHLEVRKVGYRIEELEGTLGQLQHEERQLQLQAAYLKSPQRIAEVAGDELEMVVPTLEQMIFVEDRPVLPVAGP
jgi:cell division protein FtsL